MHKCAHYARTLFTYQWASCVAMFWMFVNLPDSMCQNKALKTPLYVRIDPPLKNIFPRRGRIRVQRYENILNYANENAKNVRKICEKVQILTENKGRAYRHARHRRYYRRLLWSRCPDSIRT